MCTCLVGGVDVNKDVVCFQMPTDAPNILARITTGIKELSTPLTVNVFERIVASCVEPRGQRTVLLLRSKLFS